MAFLIKLLLSALAIMIASYLLPGVMVENYIVAFVVAGVISILNTFLRPLLIILTIPITLFTFGLFLLVINALIILLADAIVPGFYVGGFWWALLFSLIVTITTSIFQGMVKDKKR